MCHPCGCEDPVSKTLDPREACSSLVEKLEYQFFKDDNAFAVLFLECEGVLCKVCTYLKKCASVVIVLCVFEKEGEKNV